LALKELQLIALVAAAGAPLAMSRIAARRPTAATVVMIGDWILG